MLLTAQELVLSDTITDVVIRDSGLKLFDIELERSDTSIIFLSAGDILSKTSSLHIQSNGPGNLSTPLIHGLAARHTAILWQGLNIQSPINGTHDLNLLRGFGQLSYASKSLSPQIGTASLGGAILIEDDVEDPLSLSMSYSGLHNFEAQAKASIKQSTANTSQIAIGLVSNKNRYSYLQNQEKKIQELAKFQGYDFRLTNAHDFSNRLALQTNIWYQQYDRDIAPSTTSSARDAKQSDDNIRISNTFRYLGDKQIVKIQHAYFNEQLNYQDVSVDSRANNKVQVLRFDFDKSGHHLQFQHRQDKVNANFFEELFTRQITRFSYNYKHDWNQNLKLSVAVSEHLQDRSFSPLLFDVSMIKILSEHQVAASVSRSYNTPSFNDLYWPTGGNLALKPESAISMNVRWDYDSQTNDVELSLNAYYKKVSDWILWQPFDGLWTPKNERKVLSRGFDFSLSKSFSQQLQIKSYFSLSLSTIGRDGSSPELEGKQLLYIPRIKSGLSVKLKEGRWSLLGNSYFISTRYASTDNNVEVAPYLITDLDLGYQFLETKDHTFHTRIGIQNLFDVDYEHVRFYPMPLRNLFVNVNFKFK